MPEIVASFNVGAPVPVDKRMTRKTTKERDNIPEGVRYKGLEVYVEETKTKYRLEGGIGNDCWVDKDTIPEGAVGDKELSVEAKEKLKKAHEHINNSVLDTITKETVKKTNIAQIRNTRNLFDIEAVTYPGVLDYETGDVTVPTFEGKENWLATDFIPVEAGKKYAVTRSYRYSFVRNRIKADNVAYYTKDYEYISGEHPVAVSLITPPENASYMRIGFYSSTFVNYDLKYAKYMIFEVNENWKDEEITGAFYVPYERIKVDDEPDMYDKDYYSYSEVLTEGYLPNPDSGVNIWSKGNLADAQAVTNNAIDGFKPAQVYIRGNWSSAYDEKNSKYSFKLWEDAIKQAIDLKTRAQLGVFGNLYPYYDSAGHVVNKTVNGEEATICYSFPTFVFEKAYESDEYPLKLIRYTQNTYDGLPLYNAVIDWRNRDVQEYYRTALEEFASFLENNEYNGIKYQDAVSAIQIRFWGKWGEGHNAEIYAFEDLEDSETLKSIVDMYINTFPNIRLIAPVLSGGNNSIVAGHADWQKYYLTASNNVGKFGFFVDHIGSSHMQQYSEDYDGWNLKELMSERYKVAPITGEVYNSGQYSNSLITLPWLINDIMKNHISAVWYRNVTGVGKTPDYKYISTRDMFRAAYDMTGYRLFFLPVCDYVENNKVNVQIRVGNMGVAPVYGDYWNAQLVIRDSKGNEHIVDNIFDVRDVPLMPDVLTPSWKDCRVVSITENCIDGIDYTKATYFIRIVDTKGISENMYLSNIGRTEDGEYNLKVDCPEDSALMEVLETEKIKERTLFSNALKGTASGEIVALRDVSPVEHKIECKVSGEDLSAVKVYRYGKNLCPTNDITLQGMTDNLARAINITLPAGRYVLSAKFEQQGEITRVGMAARSASYVNLGGTQVTNLEESGKLTYAFEITERTVCKMQFWGIYGTSYTPTEGDAISAFSEIQLEIDNGVGEATAFEPYGCLEYTPKADGTVEGMTSLAPNMTLMTDTDGVVIDVVYNKDINKAFEEITAAIFDSWEVAI